MQALAGAGIQVTGCDTNLFSRTNLLPDANRKIACVIFGGGGYYGWTGAGYSNQTTKLRDRTILTPSSYALGIIAATVI